MIPQRFLSAEQENAFLRANRTWYHARVPASMKTGGRVCLLLSILPLLVLTMHPAAARSADGPSADAWGDVYRWAEGWWELPTEDSRTWEEVMVRALQPESPVGKERLSAVIQIATCASQADRWVTCEVTRGGFFSLKPGELWIDTTLGSASLRFDTKHGPVDLRWALRSNPDTGIMFGHYAEYRYPSPTVFVHRGVFAGRLPVASGSVFGRELPLSALRRSSVALATGAGLWVDARPRTLEGVQTFWRKPHARR